MSKAKTVISNNQNELEEKLEQKRAIDQIPARNIKTISRINANISLIIINFSQTIGPSYSMPTVLIIIESLDCPLLLLYHFFTMNRHELATIGAKLQIASHLFTHLMFKGLFTGSQQKMPLQIFFDGDYFRIFQFQHKTDMVFKKQKSLVMQVHFNAKIPEV